MAEPKKPLVAFEECGRIQVGTIRATSVLSTLNVVEFGNEVLEFVRARPGLNLLLNFEHVDYLSSVVLTELLRVHKAVKEMQGRLRLCGVSEVILEVFRITNLDQVFIIHGDSLKKDLARFERSLEIAAEDATWKDLTEQ